MALVTHCTNADCPELNIAKSVPPELAGAAIQCGECGEPTTTPAESSVPPGEDVTGSARGS